MEKRGISQLITTILIIGFTIILAAVIFTWSTGVFTGYQKTTAEKAKADLQCAQTFFNLKAVCFVGNRLNLYVENTGQTDISHFLGRFKGKGVEPNASMTGLSKYSSYSQQIEIDPDKYRLEELELFPKIGIDGKEFVCEKSVKKEIKDCFSLLGLKDANDFTATSTDISVNLLTKETAENFKSQWGFSFLTDYEFGESSLAILHVSNENTGSYDVDIISKNFQIPNDERIKTVAVYSEASMMNSQMFLVPIDTQGNKGVPIILAQIESIDHTTSFTYRKATETDIVLGNFYILKIKVDGNNADTAYTTIFRLCYSDDSGTCVI